jgi:two-component system cell cycle response regulator
VRPTATDSRYIVSAPLPITAVLAEDSPIYRRLIERHLTEWGVQFVSAQDGKEAWKLLAKPDAPRLALLDWVLPEIDGIEICRRLRSRSADIPYTYTIVLTAKGQKQEMLEAMEAGADDFIAKPFDVPELKARILVGKRIVELQQKLVSANNALQFAACHDFLTGIWNRAEIIGFLRRELARSRRDVGPVGIILADVDHFKKVNDDFGHDAGDFVLKEIAKRLSASLREYDGVGRYGGEEFLLVIPGCDLTTTIRRATQIKDLVSSKPFHTPAGTINLTLSMGVTEAASVANLEQLVSQADQALYQAKHNGRNRVECPDTAASVSMIGR